jgi:hypothetical protein
VGLPSLISVVSKLEAAVAPTVRSVVQHEAVGLSMAVATRVQRGLEQRAERASRNVLHALNLPAGSDVRRLLAQMAMVEREVRELGKALDPKASPAQARRARR